MNKFILLAAVLFTATILTGCDDYKAPAPPPPDTLVAQNGWVVFTSSYSGVVNFNPETITNVQCYNNGLYWQSGATSYSSSTLTVENFKTVVAQAEQQRKHPVEK